jgi:hypothetical protein
VLSPRAIAVQGIGYTPRLVAVQGLWPFSAGDTDTGGGGRWRGRTRRARGFGFRPEEVTTRKAAKKAAVSVIQALRRNEPLEFTTDAERAWLDMMARVAPEIRSPHIPLPGDEKRAKRSKNRLRAILLLCFLLLQ